MTGFRYWKSVGKTYREQALIYGFCQNRESPEVSPRVKEKIARLIQEAGREYAPALEEYLCTGASWKSVVTEYPISDRTLQRRVGDFLRAW